MYMYLKENIINDKILIIIIITQQYNTYNKNKVYTYLIYNNSYNVSVSGLNKRTII